MPIRVTVLYKIPYGGPFKGQRPVYRTSRTKEQVKEQRENN